MQDHTVWNARLNTVVGKRGFVNLLGIERELRPAVILVSVCSGFHPVQTHWILKSRLSPHKRKAPISVER